MKKMALIVAGGKGRRMQSDLPKQFLLLQGKPLLMHTIEAFLNYGDTIELRLVLPQEEIPRWEQLCGHYGFSQTIPITPGGRERFNSVRKGLEAFSGDGLVAIHDGVRPLVDAHTIERCFHTAGEKGNAVPVIQPPESVRFGKMQSTKPLDRKKVFLVQTPQVFQLSEIRQAYQQEYHSWFTDDASVLEATGETIHLAEGNTRNLKLTTPSDLLLAQTLLGE